MKVLRETTVGVLFVTPAREHADAKRTASGVLDGLQAVFAHEGIVYGRESRQSARCGLHRKLRVIYVAGKVLDCWSWSDHD